LKENGTNSFSFEVQTQSIELQKIFLEHARPLLAFIIDVAGNFDVAVDSGYAESLSQLTSIMDAASRKFEAQRMTVAQDPDVLREQVKLDRSALLDCALVTFSQLLPDAKNKEQFIDLMRDSLVDMLDQYQLNSIPNAEAQKQTAQLLGKLTNSINKGKPL
jgi:hypothetical protein